MADGQSSPPNPSTPSSADRGSNPTTAGFTMLELLVAFAVTSILLGIALSITLASRRVVTADQQRIRLNQTLRSSMDLLGIDVRQAGERLPPDFPAIEVQNGEDGEPDTLILRRNMLSEVLPLCGELVEGEVEEEVRVADDGADPPVGCEPVPDSNADGWPDNLGAWRDYRDANGGTVPVFVYNPIGGFGEWFLFDGDGETTDWVHKGDGDPWLQTYEVDQQGRIYMLEQRTYRLDDGLLQFTVNTNTAAPIHISANLIDFQVRVIVDGVAQDELDTDQSWTDLSALEIVVTARLDEGRNPMTRSLTARFFPRNVLSN